MKKMNEEELLNNENAEKVDESKVEVSDGVAASDPEKTIVNDNDQDTALVIAELQAKADEYNDRYMRLYSEFDNYRKRTAKERLDLIATAGQDVFKLIIPLIDDFERAIRVNEDTEDINAVKEGFKQIYNKLISSTHNKGLEQVSAIGQAFDADLHEAITNIPAPTEDLKGKVVDEIEKAYKLNGKVIRFAKVIVGQ
jgi:molecular chaperone GrpE